MPDTEKTYITEVPLTSEARELFIESHFDSQLPNHGDIFVPDDNFYEYADAIQQASNMTALICKWLGINPETIGIELESGETKQTKKTKYTIYIENSVLANAFTLGAFIAYTLARYLVEEREQIILPEVDQRASLLANATVVFGLGIVILNGIPTQSPWQRLLHRNQLNLLKNFPLKNYIQINNNFIRKYRIDQNKFSHTLMPWTSTYLQIGGSPHPTHAVSTTKRKHQVQIFKHAGVVLLLVVVIFIGSYVTFQRVKPVNPKTAEAFQKVSLFDSLTKTCKTKYAYDKQYTDTSDIQAERVLNATDVRCQSLQNQLDSAALEYNALSQ